MNLRGKKAIGLVESLVSIILVGMFVASFLGAYFVSRISTKRAEHRMTAMDILKSHMEREIKAGYDGGSGVGLDYYATVSQAVTEETGPDGKTYTVTADPYFPGNIYQDLDNNILLTYENRNYKIIGFVVSWTEEALTGGTSKVLSERAAAYVSS